MATIDYVQGSVLPAALRLLPPHLSGDEATAMLLAVGLQESCGLTCRGLVNGGPGERVSFWRLDVDAVQRTLEHRATQMPLAAALATLRYDWNAPPEKLLGVLAHNDVAAACVARCLLFTSPVPLAGPNVAGAGWDAYRAAWRPERPRRSTWNNFFQLAWQRVSPIRRL